MPFSVTTRVRFSQKNRSDRRNCELLVYRVRSSLHCNWRKVIYLFVSECFDIPILTNLVLSFIVSKRDYPMTCYIRKKNYNNFWLKLLVKISLSRVEHFESSQLLDTLLDSLRGFTLSFLWSLRVLKLACYLTMPIIWLGGFFPWLLASFLVFLGICLQHQSEM